MLDAPELADGAVSAYTIIGLLEPHLAAPIAEAAQSITVARRRSPTSRRRSAASRGIPMLRVDRLYSDASGTPVELAVSQFLPEQYTYRVTLRRSSLVGISA